jgi:uncharacterized membrane protein YgdD (TMEM256/DUF423 family)
MKKFGKIAAIIGFIGVLFGAFGAHGIRGKISDQHYDSYRTGIQYLYYHLVPLLFLATQNVSEWGRRAGYLFILGILFFTGSNVLMTTEALHHINFHFLWPVTPIGGVMLLLGWSGIYFHIAGSKD